MKKLFLYAICIGALTSSLLFAVNIVQADDPPVPPAPGELYPPEKITPENGKENTSSLVIFTWKADGAEVDKYQLIVYVGDTAKVIIKETFGKSTRRYTAEFSEDGTTYRWYVKSCKSGFGPWGSDCDERDFGTGYFFTMAGGSASLDTPPVPPSPGELYPPEKIVPENGKANAKSPVHFQWKADGSEVDKYQILIYEAYTTVLIKERVDGKGKRTFDYDLPDGEYRWYVKSCKNVWGNHDCDERDFGKGYFFTVGESAGVSPTPPPLDGTPGPSGPTPPAPGASRQGDTSQLNPPINAKSFEELIDGIINFVFWVGVAVAPVMILIAGIMYMTGGNDPTKISKAHKLVIYTGVGFAIILFAKGLIALIESVLGK